MYTSRQLSIDDMKCVTSLFKSVFTAEPWNDDWSDDEQLSLYLGELTGQTNSLSFGLLEENELIGLSIGEVKHWYSGTEYKIEEFCIKSDKQGKGAGSFFLGEIEKELKARGVKTIYLQTGNDVRAYEFYKKMGFEEEKNNVFFAKEI